MNFKIISKDVKPLVERTEIIVKVTDKVTPSNEQVKDAIAKEANKPKELIVVKKIDQKYGSDESEVFAYVYDSQSSMKKFEIVTKHMKKKEVEAKKAKEAPKEEKPAKKKEEVKEEKKE
ncbi:MAG: hypothetical protein JSW08_01830 [archaeon]|nr:MAG: hypothetical protein JSW08_01830 [archaeon]